MGGWLASYSPRQVPGWTQEVRSFVVAAVRDVNPPNRRRARECAGVLARLVAWARGEGLSIEREVLLDPAVVERFVMALDVADRSASTYRSELRRMGPILTERAPWEPKPPPTGTRTVKPPYTAVEVHMLGRVVEAQPTIALRQAGRAVFLAGVGVGADGRWTPSLEPHHVRSVDGGLVVDFPHPIPRTVPVLERYQEQFWDLASSCTTKYLMGSAEPSRNLLSRTMGRMHTPADAPRLNASRLRSTWLCDHLDRGTRMPELAAAAGLTGVTVLSDLLPYVPAATEIEYWQELWGRR